MKLLAEDERREAYGDQKRRAQDEREGCRGCLVILFKWILILLALYPLYLILVKVGLIP